MGGALVVIPFIADPFNDVRWPPQIVAFSGGKDSTALVLRMAELGEDFACLFTPTKRELPDVNAHIADIMAQIDRPLILPPNESLDYWIDFYNALPNWRMRWCTRQIKIVPCVNWLLANPGKVLVVGLRADEEDREGLYGDYAVYRYPLREWGWKIADVWGYLDAKGITIPERTDCDVCPYQRLGEWYRLWKNHPDRYARGVADETRTGHTYRSPQRDTWSASLRELQREFESGRIPRGAEATDLRKCRVCTL